jgi:hypothetical protein
MPNRPESMGRSDFISVECRRTTEQVSRKLDQCRAEIREHLDHSHRRLIRWMAVCFTLQAIANIAIDRLL